MRGLDSLQPHRDVGMLRTHPLHVQGTGGQSLGEAIPQGDVLTVVMPVRRTGDLLDMRVQQPLAARIRPTARDEP